MKKLGLIVLLMCFLGQLTIAQRVMHAIVFADTEAENIGEGCQKNYNNIRKLLNEIAKNAELKLKPYYFASEDCTTENLKNVLNSLEMATEDVVVFYYTGHGEGTKKSNWPNLKISQDGKTDKLNLKTIDELIAEKKPKSQIVIGECCNKPSDSFVINQGIGRGELKFRKRYKELFNTEAKVLICASAKGTPAYINDEEGGVFYKVFEDILFQELAKNDAASWKSLLFRVELAMSGLDVKVNGKIQTPSPTPYYEGYHIVNDKKEKLTVVADR